MMVLARMKLPPAEQERFVKKAEHILEYVEKLKKIDTSKLEATSHAVEQVNAFREDIVIPFVNIKKIIANAPRHTEDYFEVPKVIE